MTNNLIRSVLLIGFWGMLVPWLSGQSVAAIMLWPKDLDLLANNVKFLPALHVFVLGLLYTTLISKLSELRNMDELKSGTRQDMKVLVEKLERRLYLFVGWIVFSVVVCFAAWVVKESEMLRFFLIFLAANSLFLSVVVLIVSFALLLEINHCKARILDYNRKTKKREETLKTLEQHRAEGFKPVAKLEQYNHVSAYAEQPYTMPNNT